MKRKTALLLFLFFQLTLCYAQTWCGNSFIVVNNLWYTGSNSYIHQGGLFNGANLGILSTEFYLAGELQVYPGTTTPASLYYRIDNGSFSSISLSKSGTEGNNSKHYGIASVLIDTLSAGTHTLEIYFQAGNVYDSNSSQNFKASFTIARPETAGPGELVTASLNFPTAGQPLDLTFDLSKGNADLANISTDSLLYVHTGVITDKSNSTSDWKYNTSWLDNDSIYQLKSLGDNKWKLSISPSLRSFYQVASMDSIEYLAFVLRNSSGSLTGKETGDKDILVRVYEPGLQVKIKLPDSESLINKDSTLHIKALASESAEMKLFWDNNQISSSNDTTAITSSYTCSTSGAYWLIAEAASGGRAIRDSVRVVVQKQVQTIAMPADTRSGINILNDSTATLVLYAPGKSSVYALGDFNNWALSNDYMLNKDGDYWWITLPGLTPGQEYAFQYLVDGSLRIADPYTDKVLDPWNDSYIPASVYPNLKAYPTGKTTGIVSVLETGQTPYQWQNTSYTLPAKEKLVIYELLVRDFTSSHSFDAVKEKLDYLQSLGINAIELMPVNEFEGNSSWGYNPSFYFAVDKYYGTKNACKALIDECHRRGIAVIMDLVLNHSYGQSPFVQLYWDSANSRPAANNPWYNVTSPNPSYSWGYDFNHESLQTKALVDSISSYWMSEYKIDGFRFDFTKGFTNKAGDGYAYDASRISILERMANQIWARNPNAYVIFEHLADNSEETVLANAGIMLWGNTNNAYCQSIMGYTTDSDLSWGIYSNRNWAQPNLVSYMESHDEERMMYKALTYGNTVEAYSAKDLSTALDRAKMCVAFYLLQPGPKMIWQFGELGYDYSINTASDGVTIGDAHRTDPKPIRWDYYDVPQRKALYDAYALLNGLKKKYPVFSTNDFTASVGATMARSFVWKTADMNAFVVGNFGTIAITATVTLPKAGAWYNVFTGQYETFSSTSYSATLAPGEFKLFTDQAVSSIHNKGDNDASVYISGNTIWNKSPDKAIIGVYDLAGRMLLSQTITESVDISHLQQGIYLMQVKQNGRFYSIKFLKK